jgi:V/A-type H+/Na+-transporting ATPase subunit C
MPLLFSSLTKGITNTVDYAYPNTRVKAWKGSLLSSEDLKGLASAKHLEEFIGMLEQQPQYKKDMSKIAQTDLYSIENLLLTSYINQIKLASDIAPKDTKKFFDALKLLYEIELIKIVLNRFEELPSGKKMELDSSVYSPILGSDIKQFLKSVTEARNREEAVSILKETKYDFLAKMSAEEQRTPGYIASALDNYYYTNLWESTKSLSGKDAKYARTLVGGEIEMLNLLTVLRGNLSNFKSERFLINTGWGLNKKIVALAGKDAQEINSALSDTKYDEIIEEAMKMLEKEKSLFKLETTFVTALLKEYQKIFKAGGANIGVLLGFLKLKEYEIRNIRAIAIAIDAGANQKDIMELVVL